MIVQGKCLNSNTNLTMKYLLLGNGQQLLLEDIAEFLWNNGNEIYVRNEFENEIDYRKMVSRCDCIVLLGSRNSQRESFFGSGRAGFQKYFDLKKIQNEKIVLVFAADGVYCNVIPFPHKIFHSQGLCKEELARFFCWCEKLNLFINRPLLPNFQGAVFI